PPSAPTPLPYPTLFRSVRALPATSLILDGEAIALRADGTPWPFQDTMRRFGRHQHDAALRAAMPLSVFFFDCLRRDDADLVAARDRKSTRLNSSHQIIS